MFLERYSMLVGERALDLYSFIVTVLPISYLLDHRRLLFWKTMITSDNVLSRALAKFCHGQIYAIGSKYNIAHPLISSTYDVKRRIFAVFSNTVV